MLAKPSRVLYSFPMRDIQAAITLAIRVQCARWDKNQGWVADSMGLSSTSFSARMAGRVPWDSNDMQNLATIFEMDVFEFIDLAKSEILAKI